MIMKILSVEEKRTMGITQDRKAIVKTLSVEEKEKLGIDPKLETIVNLISSEEEVFKEENITNLLEELKKKHPEFTPEQIKFYTDTMAKENIVPCMDKADEKDCISSVAFLTRRHDFCSHGFEEIGDKEKEVECSNDILNKKAAVEIDKCLSLEIIDFKIDCLSGIFGGTYEKPEDCLGLEAAMTRRMCEDNVYYRMSVWQGNKKLCDNIKDEFLKVYCLE